MQCHRTVPFLRPEVDHERDHRDKPVFLVKSGQVFSVRYLLFQVLMFPFCPVPCRYLRDLSTILQGVVNRILYWHRIVDVGLVLDPQQHIRRLPILHDHGIF